MQTFSKSLKSLDPSLMILIIWNSVQSPNKIRMTLRGASSIDMRNWRPWRIKIRMPMIRTLLSCLFWFRGDGSENHGFRYGSYRQPDHFWRMLRLKGYLRFQAPTVWLSSRLNRDESEICVWLIQEVLRLKCRTLTSYNLTNAAQKLQLEKEFGLYEPTDMNGEDVSGKKLYMSKYKAVYAGVNTVGWRRRFCIWGQVRSIHFLSNWVVVICVWWRHFPTITSLVSWKVLLVTPTMVPYRFPIVTKNSISEHIRSH